MNIKRAFLVLAAALLLPGLALAGHSFATFDVTVDWEDDNDWSTSVVTLSCTSGSPLVQPTAPFMGDDNFTFILEFPDEGRGMSDCEISLSTDDEENYSIEYRTSGDGSQHSGMGPHQHNDVCHYQNIEGEDSSNCRITLVADDAFLSVHKEWSLDGNPGADINFSAVISVCVDEQGTLRGSRRIRGRFCTGCEVEGPDAAWCDFTFDSPPHDTSVFIFERTFDSIIDTDVTDCVEDPNFRDMGAGGFSYLTGAGDSRSCTIYNTIFFEGIPTLNQYGLAIMALLMLGIGFVGFRRFV